MTIDDDTRATIVRLFRIEGWPVGTIARELGLHHSTVTRTLQQAAGAPQERPPRPSMIDPYLPFVRQTLQSWPELHASRLYQMVCERGYRGGPDHFRHLIVPLRPRRPAEAYLRLRFLPGEQAQLDWADFGTVTIGRAERKLMGFVMTLSHSRHMILQYFLDAQMSNFLRGHVAAFRAFGGVPRVLLYDNLKSVVLKRHGATVVFNPNFIPFFRHYGFEPRAGGAAPRQRQGTRRAGHPLRAEQLLRRPVMARCRGPQRAGRPVERGPCRRPALAGRSHASGTRGLRRRAALPDRAARHRLPGRRSDPGEDRQDTLREI